MIDELDKKVIGIIQGDLPVDPRPFATMAERIGISEDEFVERVRSLKERGVIRRFGATLRHQDAGFSSNAMVAWLVPDHMVDKVGEIMAQFVKKRECFRKSPASASPADA